MHPDTEAMMRPDPSDLIDVPGNPERIAMDEAILNGEYDDVIYGDGTNDEGPASEVANDPTPDSEWDAWIEVVLDEG
jgi:hypothetical protein